MTPPLTVISARPLTPSTVATSCADPGPVARPMPVLLTTTTAVFVDVHVMVWPAIVAPDASRAVALNCAESFTAPLAEPGDTATEATTGAGGAVGPLTFIVALPDLPSLVAISCAEPAPIARALPA